MNVKVKICGIRNMEAAKAAVGAGADFLGFNFVAASKRYADPATAKQIIQSVNRQIVKIVGVFQNAEFNFVNETAAKLKLDYIQLHGRETPAYCRLIKPSIIKAFCLPADFPVDQVMVTISRYRDSLSPDSLYLVDRQNHGQGHMLSYEKSGQLANSFPIFFSGGLTPENVAEAVEKIKPFGVDVTAGIETDGCQDLEKIKLFIGNAKRVTL